MFRELDPDLWIKHEQNPRLLLKNIRELRLWQKAGDEDYVRKLNEFSEKLDKYIGESAEQTSVAYFCA